jgi:hypothetical protein
VYPLDRRGKTCCCYKRQIFETRHGLSLSMSEITHSRWQIRWTSAWAGQSTKIRATVRTPKCVQRGAVSPYNKRLCVRLVWTVRRRVRVGSSFQAAVKQDCHSCTDSIITRNFLPTALSNSACHEDKVARRRQVQTSVSRARFETSGPCLPAALATHRRPNYLEGHSVQATSKHHRLSRGARVGYLE